MYQKNKYQIGREVYALNYTDGCWYVRKLNIYEEKIDYILASNEKIKHPYLKTVGLCLHKDHEGISWSFSKNAIAKILIKNL